MEDKQCCHGICKLDINGYKFNASKKQPNVKLKALESI